jgi:Asparaginase
MKFQDCVAKQVLNCYFVQRSRFSPFKPCRFAPVDRQQVIENNLSRIAEAVGRILKQGATAKDVIAQVVSALRDCLLFNTGRSSVLTLDGVHEVKDVNL